MVRGWENGEWRGEVLEIGDGEEGEEWGSVELGQAELVDGMILELMGLMALWKRTGLSGFRFSKEGGIKEERFLCVY